MSIYIEMGSEAQQRARCYICGQPKGTRRYKFELNGTARRERFHPDCFRKYVKNGEYLFIDESTIFKTVEEL